MVKNTTTWYVYIVECSDGTFYTGITTDINRRIKEHNKLLQGAKYTRGKRPVKLVHSFKVKNKSQALKEECRIKKLPKKEKMNIIQTALNHPAKMRIWAKIRKF